MNKSIFETRELTQQEIYSPTPTIKIKKWYEKICVVCTSMNHEFGDYDNVGYYYCDEEQKLGNLNSFPMCNAKSCKKFNPISLSFDDGWQYLDAFQDAFGKDCYTKLRIFLDFNERMGDYKIGRLK